MTRIDYIGKATAEFMNAEDLVALEYRIAHGKMKEHFAQFEFGFLNSLLRYISAEAEMPYNRVADRLIEVKYDFTHLLADLLRGVDTRLYGVLITYPLGSEAQMTRWRAFNGMPIFGERCVYFPMNYEAIMKGNLDA